MRRIWIVSGVYSLSVILATIVLFLVGAYLPASVMLSVSDTDADHFKLYYSAGGGFRESGVSHGLLERGSVKLALPYTQVSHLRVDVEGHRQASYILSSICVKSVLAEYCWTEDALRERVTAGNSVQLSSALENGLSIVIDGSDPYFIFQGSIATEHKAIAALTMWRLLLGSLFLIVAGVGLIVSFKMFGVGGYLISAVKLHYRNGWPISFGQLATLTIVFGLVFGGFWHGVYELGIVVWFALFALLTFLLFDTRDVVFPMRTRLESLPAVFRKNCPGATETTGVILIAVLPVATLLVFSWNQEFPHSGDHQYHTWANATAHRFFSQQMLLYILLAAGFLMAFGTGFSRALTVIMVVLLLWWGSYIEIGEIFTRYPAGARLLAFPFVELAGEFDWESPINAGRLANSLGLIAWLIVLRPLLTGRWPDRWLLPVVLLVFYQLEVVYFFTSVYIDAWAVICVLLAVELLLLGRGEYDYLKACLVLGMGAVIKEPVVFLIPWFWLSGQPWKHTKAGRLGAIKMGFASVTPFVLYFLVRRSTGFSRYDYVGPGQILSADWLEEFWHRLGIHFGTIGLVLLLVITTIWLGALSRPELRQYRLRLLAIAASMATLFLLFNLDHGGYAFTGYPRFYLPVFVLFVAPLFLVRNIIGSRNILANRVLIVISIVAMIGNAPSLVDYLILLRMPDATRNFTEHYDTPIYLPIKALIGEAELDQVLSKGDAIHINHVTGWNQPKFVYPHLLRKYRLSIEHEILCGCSPNQRVVLAPFVYPAGLNEERVMDDARNPGHPRLPRNFPPRWGEIEAGKSSCLESLRSSCSYYRVQQINGFVTGAIGVK